MDKIRILAIGDVVGNPGIEALENGLERLIRDKNADFVVVNIENSADGLRSK
jgi:hypothetical protein